MLESTMPKIRSYKEQFGLLTPNKLRLLDIGPCWY